MLMNALNTGLSEYLETYIKEEKQTEEIVRSMFMRRKGFS